MQLFSYPCPPLKWEFERRRSLVSHCPCGKSNRDGKFSPYKGFSDKGYCHSCAKTFLPELPQPIGQFSPVSCFPTLRERKQETALQFIPFDVMKATISHFEQNFFVAYLSKLFTTAVAVGLAEDFFLGTSKYRFARKDHPSYSSERGAVIFWYVDIAGNIRTGKVMLYNARTGKRVKVPFAHITWAHTAMGLRDFVFRLCFFGEYLLARFPEKPVCIVESEKTAVICSVYFPQYNWLATGGANGVKWTELETCKVLAGKNVLLYPDLGKYQLWKEKAAVIRSKTGCRIEVFDYLERKATDEERKQGLDLADFLLRKQDSCGLALTDEGYPVIWDCTSL